MAGISGLRWNGQIVHGTFITRAFIRILSSGGKLVRIAVPAEEYEFFRDYRTDDLDPYLPSPGPRFYKRTRIPFEDVAIMQMEGGRTFAVGAGWKVLLHRRRVRMPLILGSNGTYIEARPMGADRIR